MQTPDDVKRLVERFDQHRDEYTSPNYNEAQLRIEFLNPFFSALGWDVENRQGFAEQYKEVISEDAIKIGGATKAPDYSFRVGGVRKFFLEAKKPSVDVTSDPLPAFQLRRYAWSAKLPLSILSDFEEFSIYDCRIKPSQKDKASTGRVRLLKYTDYPEKWGELWSTFSKEAVLKGSFDSFAVSARGKKGTEEVDDAFLGEIESWRDHLARGLALRNPKLTQRELNFVVQRTIDRIIFLRICEDRGIENYGQLQALINGENIYKRLIAQFYRADEKYNSGLFHFSPEKERPELPDELSLSLHIDDKVLKDILGRLYYPDCPYEFSVLPADILGQVYEQFLGKVIRLTPGHQAKVEDKPEVKKAGGVYYTPTYIVDYIVKNTLGKALEAEGMTPKQAAKLRVLDPACGSGSFLIVAYQKLLDWHLDYYVKEGKEKWAVGRNPTIFQASGGDWRLTTAERKRILLNNVYGVDIDSQAVEVTELSLLLKVLEGESEESINQQLKMFHERALPDLGDNIKCGNSLIGSDFLDGQLSLLDQGNGINPFDWAREFPEILQSGGFDIVIGNPPYRMLQPHNTETEILTYLKGHYVAAEFKIEMFHLFLQRGVSLLKEGGMHGHIIPTTVLNNVYAENLRRWLLDRLAIVSIAVAKGRVFEDADVHTTVLIQRREKNQQVRLENVIETTTELSEDFVRQPVFTSKTRQVVFQTTKGNVWNILINQDNTCLLERLRKGFQSLGDCATINRGLITGDRSSFFSSKKLTKLHIPILTGSDVHRYYVTPPSEYVRFERPDSAGGCWDPEVHLAPDKIVVRQIGERPTASMITEPIAVTGNIFTVRLPHLELEKCVLGVLNSRLTHFFWKIMFADFKQSFPQVTIFSLSQVPICDLTKNADLRNTMSALVDQALSLHLQREKVKVGHERDSLDRQIDAVDKEIDKVVYKLFGLTEDETRIVEDTIRP